MTVWYAGCNILYTRQSSIQGCPPCVSESHPYRITSTNCRINTVVSPDDGHIVARNMYRKEIKHTKKNCAPSFFLFTRLYRMHGKKNKITGNSEISLSYKVHF